MYKVYFINFGYFSYNERDSLEGAEKVARKAGFQSSILSPDGRVVATYCPLLGIRKEPESSAA